jgi:hypothetical protein
MDTCVLFGDGPKSKVMMYFDREQLIFLVAGMIAAGKHASVHPVDIDRLDLIAQTAVEQAKYLLTEVRQGHI